MHVVVGGVTHWLWRAVDEHETVLDVFLQRHRDTSAAMSFFQRLLSEYHVPEIVRTDKLASYGAAIREFPTQLGFRQVKRTQGFLNMHARITNLHGSTRSTISAHDRRSFLTTGLRSWKAVVEQVA